MRPFRRLKSGSTFRAPPADDSISSGIVSPDPYQQQIRRQEAISAQQRRLMP